MRRSRRGGSPANALAGARRRSSPVLRRGVLALLLCASLALVTVTYRGGVVLHQVQLQLLEVVAPIERGLNRAWDPIAGAWNWTGDLLTATRDKPRLERENAKLRMDLRVARAQADDAEKRARLLNASQQGVFPDGYDQVPARVLIRQAGTVDRSIVITVGSDDGVELDDAVVGAEGLVGRVIAVNAHTSTVALILDGTRQPTANIVSSDGQAEGGTGVLQVVSTEDDPVMRIDKVRQSAEVEVGDEVVTARWTSPSGLLRNLYPSGIPIGQVTSVSNNAANEYKVIQVIPYTDFDSLDHVMVLVDKPGMEQDHTIPTVPSRADRLRELARSEGVAPAVASKRTPTATSTAKQPATSQTAARGGAR